MTAFAKHVVDLSNDGSVGEFSHVPGGCPGIPAGEVVPWPAMPCVGLS